MTMNTMRLLFLSDTHLGFDLPFKPRVERRRRGEDFFANTEKALQLAYRGEVDAVIHGGDLFYRTRVPDQLVEMAMQPFIQAAQKVPVFIVPGNHERSRIPLSLWTQHPQLHIFDRARTFRLEKNGVTCALAGFPFQRKIRNVFKDKVDLSGVGDFQADIKILCMHQTVEGAMVGPSNYTFRVGEEIIPGNLIPEFLDVVLSGHIHRSQVLDEDLAGRPLGARVVYSGSIERTSFAEREENKHYVILEFEKGIEEGKSELRIGYYDLKARPMFRINLSWKGGNKGEFLTQIRSSISKLPPDSIVQVVIQGNKTELWKPYMTDALLRSAAPKTMNIAFSRIRDLRSSSHVGVRRS